MAGSSRKRNYQGKNQVIESSEEEDNDDGLDGTIEEYVEVPESDKGSLTSRSNYPPLNVRKLRITKLTVNSERSINMGRKSVLYGQTPKAICRSQLQAMADVYGTNLKEFAEQVLEGTITENLGLLRRFHTYNQPELTVLFDDLEICNPPIDKKSTYQRRNTSSEGTHSLPNNSSVLQNESGMSPMDTNAENINDSPDEVIDDTDENEDFSHLATCYSDLPTVLAHSMDDSSNNRVRQRKKKRSKVLLNETTSTALHKTIVSETDSDSSEVPNSPRELEIEQSLSFSEHQTRFKVHRVVDNTTSYRDKTNCVFKGRLLEKSNSSEHHSSLPTSINRDVFGPLIGGKNIESVEVSSETFNDVEERNDLENADYNPILDGLLFDKVSKVGEKVSSPNNTIGKKFANERVVCQKQSVSLVHENANENKNPKAECTTRKNSEQNRLLKHGDSYNRVLDHLLFDDSCIILQPSSKRVDTIKECVEQHFNHPFVQCEKSQLVYGGPSSSNKGGEILGTLNERITANDGQVNDSLKDKKLSEIVTNGENTSPSSLELKNSLWHSLDCSLEF